MSQLESETLMKQNWQVIQSMKGIIARELDQIANQYPSGPYWRIKKLADWFRGDIQYEDALINPEVLTIVLQLLSDFIENKSTVSDSGMQLKQQNEADTDSLPLAARRHQVGSAVRNACNRIAALPSSTNMRAFGILCYPMALGFLVWVIWVIASRTLVPQLQEAFEEFQVTPSVLTKALFASSDLISDYWYILLPLPPVTLAVLIYLGVFGQRRGNLQKLGLIFFQGRRNKLAWWLWHLSLLLQLRIEQSTAIMIAGYTTSFPWLKNRSLEWAEAANIPLLPTQLQEFDSDAPLPSPPTRFFGKAKYQLVDYAISLPQSEYKIALLNEIANYYWENDRISGDWWIYCLAAILNFLILVTGALVVIGLFGLLSSFLVFF